MSRYIIDFSLKNGLGNPSVNLYLKGCDKPLKCEGCHNWEMQEIDYSNFDMQYLINQLKVNIETSKLFHKDPWLCILGGEPLADSNIGITNYVCEEMKRLFPELKIVVYSWHEPTELPNVDYGVLGAYDKLFHVKHCLPSSTNQYIYDFNNKQKLGSIKLFERGK